MNTKLIATLAISAMAGFSNAQEQDVDVFEQQSNAIVVTNTADDEGNSMGTTIMALDSSQLGDGPMVFSTDFAMDSPFGFSTAGSSFSMLNNPSVQKDLQLVDDQLDQIKQINKDFATRIREQMEEMKDENGNFRFDNSSGLTDLIKDLQSQQQEQIENVLLPNQQERLKQVARQMKMKSMGSERALTNILAEELGLTADQKKKIKERAKQLQTDLEKKVAELKAKAKQDLFSELTQEQRDKLEQLLGDDFVVKDEDFKSRFGGVRRMLNRQRSKAQDF